MKEMTDKQVINYLEVALYKVVGRIFHLMREHNIKMPEKYTDVSQIFEIPLGELLEGSHWEVCLKLRAIDENGKEWQSRELPIIDALIKERTL